MTARTRSALEIAAALGVAALAFVVVFFSTAAAAAAAEPDGGSILDLLSPVREAFTQGRYAYAGSLVLVLAVAAARKWGGSRVPWFHTRQGSMSLVMLGSLGATLSARLADPSASLSPAMFWDATCVGVGAAGGYAAISALVVEPIVRPLYARFPRAAPLGWLLAIFDVKPADEQPPQPPPAE